MAAAIEGATGPWEYVIGLEVHAQIVSAAKLFSGASTAFGAEPNSQVSPIDAGMPGMLPVVNMTCIEQAARTGLALRGRVNRHSVFERKNYFYPDLPQGYQISQYKQPLVSGARSPSTSTMAASASSASNASMSSRMPARACTTGTRPAPSSTSTGPASG